MHTAQHKKEYRGFTLIELLLYMSLSMIMIAVLGGIGVHVLESRSKAHAQGEVLYNSQLVVETIRTSMDGAESITFPSRGATSSTLSLDMKDSEKDPTVFTVADGTVWMQIGGGEPTQLSGNGVVVPIFEFLNVAGENGPGAIRLTLHVEAYNPAERIAFSADSLLYTTMSLKYTP